MIPFKFQPGDKVFVRGISETQQVRVTGIDYPVIQQRLSIKPIVDK